MGNKKTAKKSEGTLNGKSKVKTKKTRVSTELSNLAKILTGEMALEEKQRKIEEEKNKAIEKQKYQLREGVKKGEIELEGNEYAVGQKVVQKIKLFEWEAPIRQPFLFDMRTFLIIVFLSLIFILLLAVLGHYGLMAALIALLFFVYVAGTTKPMTVKHIVTARGIETMDKLYEWHMLDQFWFTSKANQGFLIVETRLRVPGRLIFLIDEKDRSTLFVLLQDKLLYKDIKKQGKLEHIMFGDYIELEGV